MSTEAVQRLTAYDWPGNVRELKNVAERLVISSRSGGVGVGSLPAEVGSQPIARPRASASMASTAAAGPNVIQQRLERLMKDRVSFWSEVHKPFMDRDLTRDDVRELVRVGLAHTRGNYKMLVSTFNMPQRDYKRFLSFLRAYQCHVSFRPFRMVEGVPETGPSEMACA
jgi:DNA-binding NtrC family response regulator